MGIVARPAKRSVVRSFSQVVSANVCPVDFSRLLTCKFTDGAGARNAKLPSKPIVQSTISNPVTLPSPVFFPLAISSRNHCLFLMLCYPLFVDPGFRSKLWKFNFRYFYSTVQGAKISFGNFRRGLINRFFAGKTFYFRHDNYMEHSWRAEVNEIFNLPT